VGVVLIVPSLSPIPFSLLILNSHPSSSCHPLCLRYIKDKESERGFPAIKYLFAFRSINIYFLFRRSNSVRDLIFV
jgi:hypothetical protein